MNNEFPAVSGGSISPIAYSIPTAVKVAGIGRTRLYELIGNGDIEARKFGAKTLVLADSLRAYIASLPRATIGTGLRGAR